MIRNKKPMPHRVQPNIEGAVIIILALTLVLLPVPWLWSQWAAACLLMVAAILIAVRMARWQLWQCIDRPDLLVLALGYGWLVVGLAMLGMALLGQQQWLTASIHAITVGALGTLTISVMARTQVVRRFRDPNAVPIMHWASVLISLTATIRVAIALLPSSQRWPLLVVAMLWVTAFTCFLVGFWRSRALS